MLTLPSGEATLRAISINCLNVVRLQMHLSTMTVSPSVAQRTPNGRGMRTTKFAMHESIPKDRVKTSFVSVFYAKD
jgi:hypothetical protein